MRECMRVHVCDFECVNLHVSVWRQRFIFVWDFECNEL